ncbi:MAG TPA: GumC family protein [bacterium]|nr:GumC family protein [bacterium]
MEEEISLVDLIKVLRKRRIYIITLFILAVFGAYLFSKVTPKTYSAKAVIILPSEKGGLSTQLLLQSLPVVGDITGLTGGIVANYTAILKSRSAAEYVVKNLNLGEKYKADNLQRATDILQKSVKVSDTKENTIEISAEAKDPELAADIANTYISALKDITSKLILSSAQREKSFLEERLEETEKLLREAETNLKAFQDRHKMVSIDEETKVLVENIANLQAQKESTEIELNTLNTQTNNLQSLLTSQAELLGKDPLTVTAISSDPKIQVWREKLIEDEVALATLLQDYGDLHPKVVEIKQEIAEINRVMREEIERLSKALDTLSTSELFDLNVKKISLEAKLQGLDRLIQEYDAKLSKLPELSLEFSRLLRDLKLQEAIYTTLATQYEQAKISEARETIEIQVLDYAVPPEKHSKPNTMLNVLIGGVAALFLGIFLAFFLEFWQNLKGELKKDEDSRL